MPLHFKYFNENDTLNLCWILYLNKNQILLLTKGKIKLIHDT